MHECPHCNKASISTLQKLFAISPLRVSCAACHKLSYVHSTYALMALTVWIIMTWILIGLSYWFQMSYLLLGTIPAIIIAFDRHLLRAPLSKAQA